MLERQGPVGVDTECPCCGQRGSLRPRVVWFGELPLELDRIYPALEACDLFMAIGTSGHVYPAAGFVQVARAAGAHCVELNLEPSAAVAGGSTALFHECRLGPATETVPAYLDALA